MSYLAVLDNQLIRFEPDLDVHDFQVGMTDQQIQLYANQTPVISGVGYFVMKEDPGLDIVMNRATGHFTSTGYGQATLRAVALGQHVDVTLTVQRPTPKKDVA